MQLFKTKKGFTFIEVILTMLLISFGFLGVMSLFQESVGRSNDSERTLKAVFLAQERMEEIIFDKKNRGYSHIKEENYPSPEDLSAQGYPGFIRRTLIQEVPSVSVDCAGDPGEGSFSASCWAPDSGYKRVLVQVVIEGGERVDLDTLVTQWGEV